MNKTIIININGIVFHIEEDAYDVLIKYMNEVKQHFGFSADSYEIVNDIENRLAEMFHEKLAESSKEVIVLADVESVINQMGKPSDFDYETTASAPAEEYRSERKLFRDMDDRIIGGVCSGIGHYFNVEARWIRLATILLFLFAGVGFGVYLIFWMVMPKAVSRADKMAMKGEAPNLQNFKKNFEEEVASLKDNLNKAQQEVQPFLQRLGRFVEQLFAHLGKFLASTGKVILKVVGGFIVLIGLVVLFGFFVAFLALMGIWNGEDLPDFPFNIVNPEDRYLLYISVFLVIIIPLVSLMLFAIRVLFNRPTLNRNVSFGLLIVWLVALSTGLFYGFKTGGDFKQEARFSESVVLPAKQTYYLDLNNEQFFSREDSLKMGLEAGKDKGHIVINGDRHEAPDNFELSIEKSDVPTPQMKIEYTANGRTFQQALASAKKIQYRYVQKDSSLLFDDAAYIKPRELWRNQSVKLTLQVPSKTRLIIHPRLNRYLNNYNIWDCKAEGENENKAVEFIMTNEGLKCVNDSVFKQNQLKKGLR